ncbi:MAG TPA: L-histidine N(alpha)-methyltransferase [Bryobacteraceae bacterium]|jgi:dimethylhistidine N-methyltransferase|nr:L-histidine N(alpha)-methyltransferase [Bryobacteraceae bacterium]
MSFAAAPLPAPPEVDPEFAHDVENGLMRQRKSLPARWLYDDLGSALFEAITALPEYGLTRADQRVISRAAGEICDLASHPKIVLELGSGSGSKTRALLEAAADRAFVKYAPIDVSLSALNNCKISLGGIARVHVTPVEGSYLDGLERALAGRRAEERALVLFLGSTIGNFARTEATLFLAEVRRRVRPGDTLLLGADLVKPEGVLLCAYDDSLGVTAAFNLNVLGRINRELGGEFELGRFRHEARWNERGSRIEMHLRSRVAQCVAVSALEREIPFRAGETIWTESSHKFRPEQIRRMGERAGWRFERQWTDAEWPFAETLFTA